MYIWKIIKWKTYNLSLEMLISNQKICRFFSLKENNLHSISKDKIVGNKAKGRISKRVLQENKARQIFRQTNVLNPWYESWAKKCSIFGKFGVLCFLVNTRFEIRPFILLPTIDPSSIPKLCMCMKCLKCTMMLKRISETFTLASKKQYFTLPTCPSCGVNC